MSDVKTVLSNEEMEDHAEHGGESAQDDQVFFILLKTGNRSTINDSFWKEAFSVGGRLALQAASQASCKEWLLALRYAARAWKDLGTVNRPKGDPARGLRHADVLTSKLLYAVGNVLVAQLMWVNEQLEVCLSTAVDEAVVFTDCLQRENEELTRIVKSAGVQQAPGSGPLLSPRTQVCSHRSGVVAEACFCFQIKILTDALQGQEGEEKDKKVAEGMTSVVCE
jgi:hypothetical protein